MFQLRPTYRLGLCVGVLALWGNALLPADAAEVSPWVEGLHSSARLIAARAIDEGATRTFRAGVEIKLAPGWKTYWRYPGDSGVPPGFDFSRSSNLKSVAVVFPAPSRFPDGAGGHSIGYGDGLIVPVRMVPYDSAKPVLLRLQMNYAVCAKLCVPSDAEIELKLTGTESTNDAVVSAAEARVPKPAAIGDGGELAIRSAFRKDGAVKPKIVVDVASADGTPVVLFAEGPNAQWALPLPEPEAGAPAGQQRFSFALDGLPPGESARGATLRLTAVAGDKAIEAPFRLD